jgi:CheY-like chemotaxis protein
LPASQIITANNGEEGFLKACVASPDLIITGLTMPQMNGYEMVRLLRREKIGNTTLIIGLSGNVPQQSLTRAFRGSCDEFLAKPFSPEELQAKITKVLDHIPSQLTCFQQTDMFCGMVT